MKLKYFFTLTFIICLVAIEYLATTTMHIKPIENSWDKANHFVAFFVLFVLLKSSHFNIKTVLVVVLLLLFGIQIEVVQYFIPMREFSTLDIIADGIGIFMGIVFLKLVTRYSAMKETMYLLASKNNRDRLNEAVEQIENLKYTTKEI